MLGRFHQRAAAMALVGEIEIKKTSVLFRPDLYRNMLQSDNEFESAVLSSVSVVRILGLI